MSGNMSLPFMKKSLHSAIKHIRGNQAARCGGAAVAAQRSQRFYCFYVSFHKFRLFGGVMLRLLWFI